MHGGFHVPLFFTMSFEIQAHRGARSFFPENTIKAFCKAADLGIRVIELDLVVSGDSQLVVSHDPWLSGPLCSDPFGRPLGDEDHSSHVIFTMTYGEIASFSCGRPLACFPGQQRIDAVKPLLGDVFSSVDAFMGEYGLEGGMIFNLEIKSWPGKERVYHPEPSDYARLVVEFVEASGFQGRVRIQSFDYRVVREAWRLHDSLCYGLLVNDASHTIPFLNELGFTPHFLNPRYPLICRSLIEDLHGRGIRVIPWTVNRPEDMLEMKRLGADGLITDYPETALALSGLFD